jgi:serine/threonine-protein kinase RsbW
MKSVTPPAIERFPARKEQLGAIRAFLDAYCRRQGLAPESNVRLNVVLEELFTNTVLHGHGHPSALPVWVALAADGERVRVTYEDCAPPFNPLAFSAEPGLSAQVERRPVGGLGVVLARELSSGLEYAYLFGRNRVRLSVPVTKPEGAD